MVPQFETISEFLAMGGHGLYVWLSYGSTVLVLAGSYFSLRLHDSVNWSSCVGKPAQIPVISSKRPIPPSLLMECKDESKA